MAKPESTDTVIKHIAGLVSDGKIAPHQGRLFMEAAKVSKGRRVNKRKTAGDVIGGLVGKQEPIKNP